jgi:asparagine synthase (glutamine-hydrolysing)
VRGRTGKWLLRQWAEPRLPPGHLDRPKRGFHVPVGDWLTGSIASRIGDALTRNHGIQEWFQVDAIPDLVRARQAHRGGGRELFGLMQFAIWHRIFIEQPGLAPLPAEDPLDWIASDA